MHWSDNYLGLPFVEGAFDCADLAARIRREVFQQEISLPSDHGDGPFGRSAKIAAGRDALADPVEAPEDGDAVLLSVRGRVQHIGTFCLIDGESWVLHTREGAGAHLTRVRELARFGYTVEGYYRWK